MDRKHFIKMVSAGALCTGALAGVAGCASYRYLDAVQSGDELRVAKSGLEGEPFVLVRHPQSQAPVYLAPITEDSYMSLFLECTHRQCTVDPAGGQFECPCHGSRFDGEGRVLEGPARQDLTTFEVTSDEEYIYIHLV